MLIIVYLDLAKQFNKGTGFGLGLVFLSPIFLPILAFGRASYFERARVAWLAAPRRALRRRVRRCGIRRRADSVAPGFGGPPAPPSALSSAPVAPGAGWPAAPRPQGLPPLAPSTAPSTTAPAPAPAVPDLPSDSPTSAPPPFRGGTPDVVAAGQDAAQGGLVAGWYEDPGDPATVRWWDGGGLDRALPATAVGLTPRRRPPAAAPLRPAAGPAAAPAPAAGGPARRGTTPRGRRSARRRHRGRPAGTPRSRRRPG